MLHANPFVTFNVKSHGILQIIWVFSYFLLYLLFLFEPLYIYIYIYRERERERRDQMRTSAF